ncbi:MAG: glycosyltransferase family 2 protein [Pseudomonas putida]|uniref:glycosyltransferase family 2 protein n=1 Tax=Pseudomonas putida TaxID=303 RepID=UPI00207009E9|nr:glycosyltransferase [Pseudomonas putida]ELU0815008.1 glycosyltransferase [Pseudomonas putida]MDD2118997.1 glycosyltransferase [Pseudomonas putida]UPU93739.1 glycosyltransferase [Pseudomonas putida]HDS1729283.1 glycosyltransferase [Pseudomonas putida]
MKILSNAIYEFKIKNYSKAVELFREAGHLYGENVVAAHIAMCLKHMPKDKPAFAHPTRLDLATQLMLSNTGDIKLTKPQRENILSEWKQCTSRRSQEVKTKKVNPIPADWPTTLILAPLPDSSNDFQWNRNRKPSIGAKRTLEAGLSIVVPTFNRSKILDITLACLTNQETNYPFEVIVADDGSSEQIVNIARKYEALLDIKYVRQKDYGYQLCAIRNLGLRTAKFEFLAILDCDMAPNPKWVESYVTLLLEDDDVALIGPRKYIDTENLLAENFAKDRNLITELPEVLTQNSVAGKTQNSISVDWRLEHFEKTDNLRLCDTPFRFFSGGNVAFSSKWLKKAGWFDEDFNHWGGEDNEFGYRLYREGCFFRAVEGGLAYHQEPPGKENETDRAEGKKITIEIVKEKVPYFYRKPLPLLNAKLFNKPLVSIYIPAYNCAEHIVKCVDSALNQTITDLEVCICDDGSTDSTREVLEYHYGKNPRVRVISKANGGIGSASNSAVRLTRGFYIGQLDSDDYLEPDAVELCLHEFFLNRSLACVYTTNRNVNPDGSLIADGYNWPEFSREKLTTAMIAHHFRMFTARAWNLTDGFDEKITNAVDYDMYLKLSEVGPFKHINKIAYNRVLHGENTSIKKLGAQKINHFAVVNKSLQRQSIKEFSYAPLNSTDDACRRYKITNG